MDDPKYATLSSKIGESYYFRSDEKIVWATVQHQNDPSDQKLKRKPHLILNGKRNTIRLAASKDHKNYLE